MTKNLNAAIGATASLGLILSAAAGMPAGDALEALKQGNAQFAAGAPLHLHSGPERVVETGANGQAPIVTILGCSDSRVPLERIFDQGVGDIFAVRVAARDHGRRCDGDGNQLFIFHRNHAIGDRGFVKCPERFHRFRREFVHRFDLGQVFFVIHGMLFLCCCCCDGSVSLGDDFEIFGGDLSCAGDFGDVVEGLQFHEVPSQRVLSRRCKCRERLLCRAVILPEEFDRLGR